VSGEWRNLIRSGDEVLGLWRGDSIARHGRLVAQQHGYSVAWLHGRMVAWLHGCMSAWWHVGMIAGLHAVRYVDDMCVERCSPQRWWDGIRTEGI
jgi:hypothetical protein